VANSSYFSTRRGRPIVTPFHDWFGCIVIYRTGRRSKGVKAAISGHDEGDKGRKVKSYDSDGKPVYK
jgi:hypothetical protein